MKNFGYLFLLLILGFSQQNSSFGHTSADSIGYTTKAGKGYIIHQVLQGETLFALSRKYNVPVQSIKDANTGSVESLRAGQEIYIPYETSLSSGQAASHIVKSSETLFSISRQYSVTVADLRQWNNLADDNLAVGQRVIVQNPSLNTTPAQVPVSTTNRKNHTVAASQTIYSISRMYGVTVEDITSWNNLRSTNLSIGQVLIVSPPGGTITSTTTNNSMLPSPSSESQITPATTTISPTPIASEISAVPESTQSSRPVTTSPATVPELSSHDVEPSEKIMQRGMAEVIENSTDTKKYLALHKTAPVGTIMQVRNEMNNQTVFVRVVGTIPPTGDNAKVILKISKKAFDRLGAVDSRFPVEISYQP